MAPSKKPRPPRKLRRTDDSDPERVIADAEVLSSRAARLQTRLLERPLASLGTQLRLADRAPARALDRSTLENLLNHAASAARLVGHLDDAIAAGPLAEHGDTIAHGLTELLGNPDLIASSGDAVRDILRKLLGYAASAARIVGHLDDAPPVEQLANHIDTIFHELSELLGNPDLIASPDAVVPDGRVAYDGAPMLTSSCRATGGAS